jgi:hypothetical protein
MTGPVAATSGPSSDFSPRARDRCPSPLRPWPRRGLPGRARARRCWGLPGRARARGLRRGGRLAVWGRAAGPPSALGVAAARCCLRRVDPEGGRRGRGPARGMAGSRRSTSRPCHGPVRPTTDQALGRSEIHSRFLGIRWTGAVWPSPGTPPSASASAASWSGGDPGATGPMRAESTVTRTPPPSGFRSMSMDCPESMIDGLMRRLRTNFERGG